MVVYVTTHLMVLLLTSYKMGLCPGKEGGYFVQWAATGSSGFAQVATTLHWSNLY